MLIGLGVLCPSLYCLFYLNVSFGGLMILRADFSVIVYLLFCGFCSKGFLFLLVLGIDCVI